MARRPETQGETPIEIARRRFLQFKHDDTAMSTQWDRHRRGAQKKAFFELAEKYLAFLDESGEADELRRRAQVFGDLTSDISVPWREILTANQAYETLCESQPARSRWRGFRPLIHQEWERLPDPLPSLENVRWNLTFPTVRQTEPIVVKRESIRELDFWTLYRRAEERIVQLKAREMTDNLWGSFLLVEMESLAKRKDFAAFHIYAMQRAVADVVCPKKHLRRSTPNDVDLKQRDRQIVKYCKNILENYKGSEPPTKESIYRQIAKILKDERFPYHFSKYIILRALKGTI